MVVALIVAVTTLLAPSFASAAVPTSGKTWKPGSTLKVYSQLPARYDRSVAAAIEQYARTGARIRFARTTRLRGAQVVLRLKPVPAAALSTQGRTRSGRSLVRINPAWDKAARGDGPYFAALLIAHELGHVLGLDHPVREPRLCTAMNSKFASVCRMPKQAADTWVCGLLQPVDHAALVRLYGGRAAGRRPWFCKLPGPAPLSSRVQGAAVEPVPGSDSVAARVRWTPVAGLRMLVERRDARCDAVRRGMPVKAMADSDADNTIAAPAGVAEDPFVPAEPVDVCYSLTLLDAKTGARSATVSLDATLQPVAEPSGG